MIDIKNKVDCCGCNVCGDICPKDAIHFETDIEGIWYPKVDINKCIDCHLCEKVCPIEKDIASPVDQQAYAAVNKDKKIFVQVVLNPIPFRRFPMTKNQNTVAIVVGAVSLVGLCTLSIITKRRVAKLRDRLEERSEEYIAYLEKAIKHEKSMSGKMTLGVTLASFRSSMVCANSLLSTSNPSVATISAMLQSIPKVSELPALAA